MAFDYQICNLEALIAQAIKCQCPDKAKLLALKQVMLDMISNGTIKQIKIGNKYWTLPAPEVRP